MRVIVLLLAISLVMGAAVQAASASPDAMAAIAAVDDAPDPAPVVPDRVAAPSESGADASKIEAQTCPPGGRMHAVLVFRPPR